MKQGKAKGHEVVIALRQQRAMDMRMLGYSYRAIAKDCGVNEATSYKDVQSALSSLDKVKKDTAEKMRDMELVRLDHMTQRLAADVNRGDTKAILAEVIQFIQAHTNERGYLNLNISKRNEVGQYGDTHSISLDTWKKA